MPSTRKQSAKARKLSELDIPSDYGNMDIMLGESNSYSIERGLENVFKSPEIHVDPGSLFNRENSSQDIEIRNIQNGICPTRRDGLVDSDDILSGETDLRISQVMDSLMNILLMQIRRAIKDRVILELQIIVGTMFSAGKESGTGMFTCHQDLSDQLGVSNNNLSKKDYRSAFDLKDTEGLSPYTVTGANEPQQPIPDFF